MIKVFNFRDTGIDKCDKKIVGYSPFRDIASSGAFRRIFTVAFDMLLYVRLGDCPARVGNWPRSG